MSYSFLLGSTRAVAPKTIVNIESRGRVEFSLHDLMESGALTILEQVENQGLAFVQFRKSKAIVSAGAYVGLIPLTEKIWLNIQPRLPVSNIDRVLEIAVRPLSILPASSRTYIVDASRGNSVLAFLLQSLTASVRTIQMQGFYKTYVGEMRYSNHPRGRIDLLRSMRRARVEGKPHSVASTQFEQTSNTPINRVIREALSVALQWLLPVAADDNEAVREGGIALRAIPGTVGAMRFSDIVAVEREISRSGVPHTRDYYYQAVSTALLILKGKGIELSQIGEDIKLDSFVVNFETMFEDYLRNVLSHHMPSHLTVKNGNREAKKHLYDDNESREAQPDIVIKNTRTGRLLIVEIKYKPKVDREDINQAVTYGFSFRANKVVLLYLATTPSNSGIRHIGAIQNLRLSGYRFNLGATTLESEEFALAMALTELAETNI